MALYLLDSTVHIHWIRGIPPIVEWLERALSSSQSVVTSAIAVSEIYAGAGPREEPRWDAYFGAMTVLPLTHSEARRAGQLRYSLARSGRQLHFADSLIAATAIEASATVVTANAKDFAITGASVLELRS